MRFFLALLSCCMLLMMALAACSAFCPDQDSRWACVDFNIPIP